MAEKTLRDAIAADFIVGGLMAAAVEGIKSAVRKKTDDAASHVIDRELEAARKRSQLFNDMRELRQSGNPLNNIRRHIQNAKRTCRENDLIVLLSSIPEHKDLHFKPVLEWLETLSDADFNEQMDLLEHDRAAEMLRRILYWLRTGDEKLNATASRMAPRLHALAAKIRTYK